MTKQCRLLDPMRGLLEGLAFDREEPGFYSMRGEAVSLHLWEISPARANGKLAIKMGISIVDPFLDPEPEAPGLAITGFLNRAGADISENAVGHWWSEGDKRSR